MAFPHAKIRSLFRKGEDAQTTEEKGACLEEIASLIFGSVPGIALLDRDVVNSPGSMEIDLVFLNTFHKNGFFEFERFLIAECKNWATAVNAATLRDFILKVERKKRSCGFLFATQGITGDRDSMTAAYDEIRMALALKNIYIVVISQVEIEGLRTSSDFVRLVQTKIAKIILKA